MAEFEINRRSLIRAGAVAAGAGAVSLTGVQAATPAEAAPRGKRPKMVVATQRRASTVAQLQDFKRHGVERVCGYPPNPPLAEGRGHWLQSEVDQTKEFIESGGLEMDMVALPFLGSTLIDRDARPAIMLGKSPERDRDIDDIHKIIEVCAKAGVSTIKYNLSLLGVLSTGDAPRRGGSESREFRAKDLDYTLPNTIAGRVSAAQYWERIDYFLERVVPVAEEFKVRMACHPQDPGTPPGGYRGVKENVLSVPDGRGLFKLINTHSSPYHGLNLCLGTLAEMLWDVRDIYGIVRRLAARERIFNIHMRNIRGRRNSFEETWIDEGDIDFARIVNILADAGYSDGIDPDHVPDHPDDPTSSQAYAHGYGYIGGLIKAANHRR